MASGSMRRRGLLGILLATPAAGCGFRPLYGEFGDASGSAREQLGQVNVLLIPERNGQLLRQALQARLERDGAGGVRRYDLAVQYGIASEGIGIQRDNSTSRVRLVGTANWVLRSQDPQRSTIASGTVRSVDAYNVINQQFFAAELGSVAVQRRMAEAVADELVVQIASHFSRSAARS